MQHVFTTKQHRDIVSWSHVAAKRIMINYILKITDAVNAAARTTEAMVRAKCNDVPQRLPLYQFSSHRRGRSRFVNTGMNNTLPQLRDDDRRT
jgi:hypothetical protein